MIESLRTIQISTLSSVILLTALAVHFFIYPKKKINYLLLVMLFSIPPLISLLRPGSYESGDFTTHVYRSIVFFNALREGLFAPSWAADLNASYGYPLFIFNYPLPYYLVSFFHILGFSFVASMKVFLAANFLLSGIFMYLCARKLFKNDLAAFIAAIFYQFAPYHLIDIHFKITIGEIMVFTVLPMLFYLLFLLWEKITRARFALTSLTVVLLVMSHVVLAFFALILLLSYASFLFYKNGEKAPFLITIAVFLAGSISSLYIWLTPFFLAQYTMTSQFTGLGAFPKLSALLFSPWRYGLLFQGPKGEISLLLGYTHIFVVFSLLFLLARKKITKKHTAVVAFWLLSFFVIIFFVSEYSGFAWITLPFLKSTGGSHRLLVLASFTASFLAGYLSISLSRRRFLLMLLVGITVYSTILNWGHRRVIPEIGDQALINNLGKSTAEAEGHWYANSNLRSNKNPWFRFPPRSRIEIVRGRGEVRELQRSSTKHRYIIAAETPLQLRENTLYFPGWIVFVNDRKMPIHYDKEGRIAFELPEGLNYVEVRYEDVYIYKILKTISAAGILTMILLLLSSLIYNRKQLWGKT